MKRTIIFMFACLLVSIAVIFYNWMQYESYQTEVNKFNKDYLEFNRDNLYGVDITTVINKAMDNNENYKIKKDENGIFISDQKYSVKIYINFQEEGSTYQMEKFYQVGIKEFTKYFGSLKFKCASINYHDNGRISEMFFQAINY